LLSAPAYVPICFECTVLLASLSGLYAFFVSAGLPKLDHPLQLSEDLQRATVDRFVLAVRGAPDSPKERLAERLYHLGAEKVVEVPSP
jgi:hypothetical protein